MALPPHRVVRISDSPHEHERSAIQHVIDELPPNDPYHVYTLFELLDPSTGRLYEYDLLVVGYSDLYHVEIKSGPGRYEGDSTDWHRITEEGARRWMEPPLVLANRKSKILKSRLESRMKERCPYVHTLVFLSAPGAQLALRPDGLTGVVTRGTIGRALTHHEFPNAGRRSYERSIPRPVLADLREALSKLGLRKRDTDAFAGTWRLGDVLEDGPGYQDRLASHRDDPTKRRRARIYLVPQEERIERRQQLRRAAEREWQLLWELRDHPNILRASDQIPDAPLGPVVLFDDVPGALRLDAFLRGEPTLSFDERFSIIEQVGLALSYCHKKGIVHSALSPESVLVRRGPAGTLEARLYDFQLADSETISGTHHWTELAAEPWRLYQAPELRRDPTARSPASDLYSLGALALFVLTGRPPAASLVELEKRLQDHQTLLSSDIDWGALPGWLRDLVGGATASTVAGRYDDVDGWLEVARSDYTADLESRTRPAGPAAVDAKLAVAGDIVAPDLTVVKVLGQGATARVVEVERRGDGRHFALKVPLGPDHHARIEAEALELEALDHPNVVRLEELRILSGRPCLLLGLAGSQTLFHLLQREGSLGLDLAIRYGEELLAAVRHLEQEGRLHRDIKPANLGVGSADRKALRLVLFDFSLAAAPLTDVSVGTAVYRDPFLYARGRWDAPADRWSVAVTLHEILTGTRPSFGGRPGGELDPAAPLVLAAERFDAAVRDRLVQFFHRALARDAEARFDSAESMRRAWTACFADPLFAPAGEAPRPPHAAVALTVPFEWAKLAPDAPLAALPLDLRAKNALDRAGLVQAGELLSLADNRLSAIRGIGRQTSRAILEARDAWKAARAQAALEPPTPPAFHPAYVGPDLLLTLPRSRSGARVGARGCRPRHALNTRLRAGRASCRDRAAPSGRTGRAPHAPRPRGGGRGRCGPPGDARRMDRRAVPERLEEEPPVAAPSLRRRSDGTRRIARARARCRHDRRALRGDDSERVHRALEVEKGPPRQQGRRTARRGRLPLLDEHRGVAALATLADALASRIPHASDVPRELVRVRTAALVRALAEAEKPAQDDDPPGRAPAHAPAWSPLRGVHGSPRCGAPFDCHGRRRACRSSGRRVVHRGRRVRSRRRRKERRWLRSLQMRSSIWPRARARARACRPAASSIRTASLPSVPSISRRPFPPALRRTSPGESPSATRRCAVAATSGPRCAGASGRPGVGRRPSELRASW
jgi:serine/threonine protein kinase